MTKKWSYSSRIFLPLEHTPDPPQRVYQGILFILGFKDAWSMLKGYVGVFLDLVLALSTQSNVMNQIRTEFFAQYVVDLNRKSSIVVM